MESAYSNNSIPFPVVKVDMHSLYLRAINLSRKLVIAKLYLLRQKFVNSAVLITSAYYSGQQTPHNILL